MYYNMTGTYVFSSIFWPKWPSNSLKIRKKYKLECGPMPNMMATLKIIGGALCSMPQSLADAQY